jgi:hypothetical protein
MISEDLKNISELYECVLISESPDNITVNGEYYDYANKADGNYTGIITENGKFAMSKDLIGHGNLLYELRSREDIPDLKTNFESMDELYSSGIIQHPIKFRIWSKFDVYSMWDRYKPSYKAAIDNSIVALGKSPEEFRFDPPEGGGNEKYFLSYGDYVLEDISDEAREEISDAERRKIQDQKALGDYMAGGKKKPIDYSEVIEPKKPSFYRREGD